MFGSILFIVCLGSLLMLNWRLLMKVARLRRSSRVAVGIQGEAMERAVAAHRNFIENTPINLIAPSIVFINGHTLLASVPVALLLAGRLFHARSVQRMDEGQTQYVDRIRGMKLTFAATLSGIGCLVVSVVLGL